MISNNQQAFLELVRAGLWEKEAGLSQYGNLDYTEIMRLAQEQAVVGLVTAGLEHVKDVEISQVDLLQFIGQSIQIEQRNKAMNDFIATLIGELRKNDIYALLVKGQGLGQCYERPQWRMCGDIDLFLSGNNLYKAKLYLEKISSYNKPVRNYSKEFGAFIDPWMVELHGTLRTGLSLNVDSVIDEVQKDVFYAGNVRSWLDGNTPVFIPGVDNDVFFVFTHFIKHFYKEGGVKLRQICDWCRLLWVFKDKVNIPLLEKRLTKSGLVNEWQAFAALAVDCLGMPVEAMPLNSSDKKWRKKEGKIISILLRGGEWRKVHDTFIVGQVFPFSVLKFASGILLNVNWLKIKECLLNSSDNDFVLRRTKRTGVGL